MDFDILDKNLKVRIFDKKKYNPDFLESLLNPKTLYSIVICLLTNR